LIVAVFQTSTENEHWTRKLKTGKQKMLQILSV